jgi:hypothetical protein
MNGDFKHSTPIAERLGTVQFAIFHPYSSLKGCRDGMPEVTKRIKPQLFQPRRKLTSQGSLNCIAIVQQSWPECERLLEISSLTRNLDGIKKGRLFKNRPPEMLNN